MNRFLNCVKGLSKQGFHQVGRGVLQSSHKWNNVVKRLPIRSVLQSSHKWNNAVKGLPIRSVLQSSMVKELPIQCCFDQGHLNSCSIVASTELAYYSYVRENGTANLPARFSVQRVLERLDSVVNMLGRRRTEEGRKYGYGAHPWDILNYIKIYGVVDSIECPYKYSWMSRSREAFYKSERRYYIRSFKERRPGSKYNLRALLQSSLVLVNFHIGETFQNYQDGIYRGMTKKEKRRLRIAIRRKKVPLMHAIVIIGWGIEKDEVIYLAKNSWGKTWGLNGFMKISETAIREGTIYTCFGGYYKDITFGDKSRVGRGGNGGVTLYGGPRSSSLLNLLEAKSFHHEYNSRACTIEIVNDVKAAVDHIRRYGSGHTECIVAEKKETAEYFLHQVDSAAVFHNASTRFCDGMRFGLGAEVGISTSKIHARGPVGLEGLLTTKWVLRGNGHVVQKDDGVIYTHKNLSVSSLDELEADLATTGMLLEMDNSELLHLLDSPEALAAKVQEGVEVITSAIPQTVGEKLIGLVTSKEDIPDLLKLDDVIDLVIPRGSNRLVSQIKSSTKIVVLGHSDGICHVYVDKSANMKLARRVVVDSKLNYPAACNAMETILVHQDLSGSEGLQDLLLELSHGGVTLYGGPRSSTLLNLSEAKSFHHEYNSRACTIEIVNDVKAAVDHIRRYGSGHIECIVAENKETAEYFLHQVDSAAVFHNASTRFCDGMRFGLGAEVGISTSKIHARGPVGLEGLLTTKWVLRGNGHVVQKDDGVIYTHKNLSVSSLDELEPDLATTGMLLEMDNSKLLHLLDSPEALAVKVHEGVEYVSTGVAVN